jgi:alpha-tubulin suppressor-like RCC1 family protein
VAVSGIQGATAITAGSQHSCALLGGGTVKCWGDNTYGQLGDGTTDTMTSTPVTVTGLSGTTAIAAGADHTCALLTDGSVKCWGANHSGQLGDGTTTNWPSPMAASGISMATAITAGTAHTCALFGDGTVRCWGSNGSGQLGDGTWTDRSAPVTVTGLSGATANQPW